MAHPVRPSTAPSGPVACTLMVPCRNQPRCPVCGVILHPLGAQFIVGLAFCELCANNHTEEARHLALFFPTMLRLKCWKTSRGLIYYSVDRAGHELWPLSDECRALGIDYVDLFEPIRHLVADGLRNGAAISS